MVLLGGAFGSSGSFGFTWVNSAAPGIVVLIRVRVGSLRRA